MFRIADNYAVNQKKGKNTGISELYLFNHFIIGKGEVSLFIEDIHRLYYVTEYGRRSDTQKIVDFLSE